MPRKGYWPTHADMSIARAARVVIDPGTLETLPGGPSGERLKRALLNCIEEVARAEGLRLPSAFFERRGRVVNGDG